VAEAAGAVTAGAGVDIAGAALSDGAALVVSVPGAVPERQELALLSSASARTVTRLVECDASTCRPR